MPRRSKRTIPLPVRAWLTWPVLGWCVSLYLAISLAHLGIQEYHLLRQARILDAEVKHARSREIELRARIADARTLSGVERIARERLGLTRPGEMPVRFLDPTPTPAP